MGLFSCWHLCDYHFLFFTGIFKLRNHTILVKASYTEKYWQPNAKLRNTKFPFYLNHPLVLIENQKKISQANHYILQPTDDWKCFKNSTWQLFACLPNNTNIKLCFMPLFYLDSIYYTQRFFVFTQGFITFSCHIQIHLIYFDWELSNN